MITGLYASIFVLFLVYLILNVVRHRFKHKVSIGHGGIEELERHIRIHGNFIETVPIGLFLMLIVELGGTHGWIIHAMGLTLLIGRVVHVAALAPNSFKIPYGRQIGMTMTLTVFIIGAVLSLMLSLSTGVGLLINE